MSLLIIHFILMSEPPVSLQQPCYVLQGLERLCWKALWAPAGTADLILLRKGQT